MTSAASAGTRTFLAGPDIADLPALPGLHAALLGWYAAHARELPWRHPDRTPWGVLVSEVMLQQTPVARVEPVWREWMRRWPTPGDLARAPAGEAVRAWGRLGYPRRALRLHAAATILVERHDGRVPEETEQLRRLPGVGEYTAAAVVAFAYGRSTPVMDTNVRRVLARVVNGVALPGPHLTRAEVQLAASLLPAGADAPTWSVAVMELGALRCTARSPRCAGCPLAGACRWRQRGYPAHVGPPRRGQAWAGTDRQCRGVLLQAVREAPEQGLERTHLEGTWSDTDQAGRCVLSLVHDGLLALGDDGRLRLPA